MSADNKSNFIANIPLEVILNVNATVHRQKHNTHSNKILPSPPVTGVTPVKQLIVVVFPAPLGPRRQNN